jgi:16S rRNA processing protein RimM
LRRLTVAVPDHSEQVVVARIAGAFGVLGWVRIVSFTDPPENLLQYRPWFLQRGPAQQQVDVAEVRPHGSGFVARFRDVANREEARALTGSLIAVPRSALPPPDESEYYWQDLLGMAVVDADGAELGTVEQLMDTGAHDVLVVRGDHGSTLIPFVDRFVLNVDLAGRQIRVDWQDAD